MVGSVFPGLPGLLEVFVMDQGALHLFSYRSCQSRQLTGQNKQKTLGANGLVTFVQTTSMGIDAQGKQLLPKLERALK